MAVFAFSAVATGIESFSAKSSSSFSAPEAVIPPPATIIGRFAFASSFNASSISESSGSGRKAGILENGS